MNVANVVPFSAPHAVAYAESVPYAKGVPSAKSADAAALNPVRARFDRFELDEANARLFRDGAAVAIAPTPFAVLCALARKPGCLLTTNALLDEVWGHQYVTDSVLRTAISELRTVLEDDARKPRFIETVSRRGYRFISATIGASSLRAPAIERNVAAGRDHPAWEVLTALCRGDAALAGLIRAVAITLEREPLVLNES